VLCRRGVIHLPFGFRLLIWNATTPAMGAVCFSGLGSRDLAHGVVEGQAEDLGTEVDGVAGRIALWPSPITVTTNSMADASRF
jgi:hypothetical protein